MKIWFSHYILKSSVPANRLGQASGSTSRNGFLLKIETADFEAGYADVHPWTQFGDESVEHQLQRLRENRLSPLLERSFFFAWLDGQSRALKKSLFKKSIKVKSHFNLGTLPQWKEQKLSQLAKNKYTTLKLKVGLDIDKEVAGLRELPREWQEAFRWRLDFNGKGAEKFLKKIPDSFLENIDLIEDPEPFHLSRWRRLEKTYGVVMAYDQPPSPLKKGLFKGPRIIKPARQEALARRQDVITHSMDHPVGQSFAFLQAQASVAQLKKQFTDYGLKSQDHYEVDSHTGKYFAEISSQDPYFKCSEGWGIGFNDLLRKQKWIRL